MEIRFGKSNIRTTWPSRWATAPCNDEWRAKQGWSNTSACYLQGRHHLLMGRWGYPGPQKTQGTFGRLTRVFPQWYGPNCAGRLRTYGRYVTSLNLVLFLALIPVIEDIVHARLRTLGAEDHHFMQENGAWPCSFSVFPLTRHTGSEWYIYDVGGSRSMWPQWVPYFDDGQFPCHVEPEVLLLISFVVQAIIFLAPLAFNQVLKENKQVNWLEDSIYLWKEVCKNPLLTCANIIVFFNKTNTPKETLQSGIRVETYVPSYGSTPNDMENVMKYFKEKFWAYHVSCILRYECDHDRFIETIVPKTTEILVKKLLPL